MPPLFLYAAAAVITAEASGLRVRLSPVRLPHIVLHGSRIFMSIRIVSAAVRFEERHFTDD